MDVILLSEQGEPIGTRSKESVHTAETPLHLAFSCHVMNAAGQVLVTRRSLDKLTWPGVWTNSFCGHPQPGESFEDAIRRHAAHELGMEVAEIKLELPDFRYRAVDASGIVENEICPVFTAAVVGSLLPNPEEVMDLEWADPQLLRESLGGTPWAFSPWFVLQAQELGLYA